MLPIRDENPKPPGYRPYVTYALILINVLVFFWEISVTQQIFEFTNKSAEEILLNYGTVPVVITNGIDEHNYVVIGSIFSSMFLHAGVIHIGGTMLFLWIFGDNIEFKFGRGKYLTLYLFWGLVAGFVHVLSDPSRSNGSGVAFFAHIGGFLIGMITGFLYKKTHSSEFMYGTRYGWKDYK